MRKHGIDALLPAIVGGLLAIALSLVIRSATGTKLLAEIVLDASSFGLQPRGFSFLLGVFGPAAKPLLFTSVLLGKLAFYVLLWRTVTQRFGTRGASAGTWPSLTVASSAVLLLRQRPAHSDHAGGARARARPGRHTSARHAAHVGDVRHRRRRLPGADDAA